MRAAQGPSDGRHERAIARPRRARDAAEVEDEAPVVVDERGEVVDAPGEGGGEGGDGEEKADVEGGAEEVEKGYGSDQPERRALPHVCLD